MRNIITRTQSEIPDDMWTGQWFDAMDGQASDLLRLSSISTQLNFFCTNVVIFEIRQHIEYQNIMFSVLAKYLGNPNLNSSFEL